MSPMGFASLQMFVGFGLLDLCFFVPLCVYGGWNRVLWCYYSRESFAMLDASLTLPLSPHQFSGHSDIKLHSCCMSAFWNLLSVLFFHRMPTCLGIEYHWSYTLFKMAGVICYEGLTRRGVHSSLFLWCSIIKEKKVGWWMSKDQLTLWSFVRFYAIQKHQKEEKRVGIWNENAFTAKDLGYPTQRSLWVFNCFGLSKVQRGSLPSHEAMAPRMWDFVCLYFAGSS